MRKTGTQVSLTAPKLCARLFKGKMHFLGGRFVPPPLREKYEIAIPPYVGSEQVVQLPLDDGASASTAACAAVQCSWLLAVTTASL